MLRVFTVSLYCAAVDTRSSARRINTFDGEERKKEDYDNLVNTALRKAGSTKALLPTKSKNQFKEIDLRDLTLTKRKFVVEQALEVTSPKFDPARIALQLAQDIAFEAFCANVQSVSTVQQAFVACMYTLTSDKMSCARLIESIAALHCWTDLDACRARMQMLPSSLANSRAASKGDVTPLSLAELAFM